MKQEFYVYVLANKKNGSLYVGVTRDLPKRVWKHKNGIKCLFTKKYYIHNLVYYESFESIEDAIRREKNLKDWHRAWKVSLIERYNPNWDDLYEYIDLY